MVCIINKTYIYTDQLLYMQLLQIIYNSTSIIIDYEILVMRCNDTCILTINICDIIKDLSWDSKRKEVFYLMIHSAHCIHGYVASYMW